MYHTVTNSSHLKKLLAVIALAIFIDSLDGSIVNIALPKIAEGFSVVVKDRSAGRKASAAAEDTRP